MPSSNGVYSLPPGYVAATGGTIQISQHNPVLEDIAAALTGRLSRDGSAAMTGGLKAIAGTAAVPGYTFSTDTSTGLLKTANGIGVSVGGVQVAEFLPGGINGARFLGELIPYTCRAVLPLTVLPYGQTLSRTTYAALWAQAQIEIAAGGTMYNNGDGSTTFGIMDMRGRVPAGWDAMGGVAASRLTAASFVGSLGAVGGGETRTITQGNLPAATLTTSIVDPGHSHTNSLPVPGAGATWNSIGGSSSNTLSPYPSTGTSTTGITASTQLGGSGQALPVVQPTLVCNYLLFAGV